MECRGAVVSGADWSFRKLHVVSFGTLSGPFCLFINVLSTLARHLLRHHCPHFFPISQVPSAKSHQPSLPLFPGAELTHPTADPASRCASLGLQRPSSHGRCWRPRSSSSYFSTRREHYIDLLSLSCDRNIPSIAAYTTFESTAPQPSTLSPNSPAVDIWEESMLSVA